MQASELANAVFNKIANDPPPAERQAQMLVDAMQSHLASNVHMDIKQVNEKFVKMTGAIKDENAAEWYAVVGRFGEVVVYEGVNEYFKIPAIKEMYGMHVIDSMASVLIPADAHKASQSRDAVVHELKNLDQQAQQKAFKDWFKVFKGSGSVPDFFMANAYPLEVKSKTNSYIFLSDKGGTSSKKYNAGNAKNSLSAQNAHFANIFKKGGTILIGGLWVDTIWEDITEELEPFVKMNKAGQDLLRNKTKALSSAKGGLTLKYDWQLPSGQGAKHGEGRLFSMIGLHVSAFVPMVANKDKLAKIVEKKVVKRADMDAKQASSTFLAEAMISGLEVYRNYISSS